MSCLTAFCLWFRLSWT